MGQALAAVLAFKDKELQQEQMQASAMKTAFDLFNTARQNAAANQLAMLQHKAGLAKDGLVADPSAPSGFRRDSSLQDPMVQEIINGGKFKPKSLNVGGVTLENAEVSDLKAEREERLVKQQQFANSTKLRQEFINRPEVKDYMTVSPNIRSMESFLSKAMSGDIQNAAALDQGLITMYNKLTDPQSVVRESEYARTPENLPFVNRFNGAIQKIKLGGAGMTHDDRKALVQGAKIIANERGAQFQETKDQYKSTSAEYGLDDSLVTRDIPDFKKYDTDIESAGKVSGKDVKAEYNALRAKGISVAEAKKKLGL